MAKEKTAAYMAIEPVVNELFVRHSKLVRRNTSISILLGTIIKCAEVDDQQVMKRIIVKNIVCKYRENSKQLVFCVIKDILTLIAELGMLADKDNVLKITLCIKDAFVDPDVGDIELVDRCDKEIFDLLFQGKTSHQISQMGKAVDGKAVSRMHSNIFKCKELFKLVEKYLVEEESRMKPNQSSGLPCGGGYGSDGY